MGIFHKTLNDIQSEIMSKKHDYGTAYKILLNHINTEHELESDLIILKNAIIDFDKSLKKIRSDWTFPTYSSKSIPARPEDKVLDKFNENIRQAKEHLRVIEKYIKKLIKDQKLLE